MPPNYSKNILITGGAGFIGSHLVAHLLEKYPNYLLINLDALTYAGKMDYVKPFNNYKNHIFIQENILNKNKIKEIFNKYQINGVFHLAAETHVDNAIENPEIFLKTNILGTQHLLDVAYETWFHSPKKINPKYTQARFLQVSTDEVFGSTETKSFSEQSPYAPNNPYSVSKAAADMLVKSYYHTYGMNTVTTISTNNYGEHQHGEKFIPTIIQKALNGECIPIYGNGENVRDWIYVKDHCEGLDMIYHKGKRGEKYNISAEHQKKNIDLAKFICENLHQKIPFSIQGKSKNFKSYTDLITLVKDRPGHDKRYALDTSKIKRELNWKAETSFEEGLEKTISCYIEKYISRKKIKK